ncbi:MULTISPECIES: hypothetical protein [Methylobacterium]|uniref:ATPase n=2 Tax=Pseudomonadota TaxID=1224 RepID=A0ABQ4SV59_9HYPH|nr:MULTISPECIES: hypothetical protein [Methylobacterium]PIU05177.1 MAG: hypothetical protein COT56_16235 [Methylobacterium sp. CG09_land_8_20_14_0_10_71_15]PIU15454.1 MAG: hypothetical protein COT28_04220 [Methylobacterium sp. CG08_land_8_20_14_0_20_71_15]GBU16228.1 hypothetical protein AwMethylo_04430 [Methylobacterium sp.]GJE06343.1 hypothetical protein AOPFMNJM_1659 [Methylobacterium jeotgali]
MAEPARHATHHEAGGRPATAPLRDWLAAIRAQAVSAAEEPVQERGEPDRGGWAPRLVETAPETVAAPAAEAARDPDITELMAENMLLKAQLRIEGERYAEIQAMLADELRDLRRHVESEMQALAEIREERDLWQARAEALAQPLFQKR